MSGGEKRPQFFQPHLFLVTTNQFLIVYSYSYFSGQTLELGKAWEHGQLLFHIS